MGSEDGTVNVPSRLGAQIGLAGVTTFVKWRGRAVCDWNSILGCATRGCRCSGYC